LLPPHATPMPFLAAHAPALQKSPAMQSPSLVQVVGQLKLEPLHRYCPQPVPAEPAASAVHVPLAVSELHVPQPPLHAELQHTLCTQKFDWH
jgi:hypothetical protein